MRREPIDFQDGYESRADEALLTDPGLKSSVRHSFIPGMAVRGGKACVFEDPEEPSVFDAIIDKAYSLKSKKEAWEFIEATVLRMVMVLKMPRAKTSEIFCKAWILDILDERVDINATDPYNDRWYDHILYPRLSHLAQKNPASFRKFQLAIGRFVNLPDLSSTNPTIYRKRAA